MGDPWGISSADHQKGDSMVVVRTENGRAVLERTRVAGYLSLHEITYEDVIRGQKIDVKRSEWTGYVRAWKTLGLRLPEGDTCIQHAAGDPARLQKYFLKQLQWSLNLDQYESRDALIQIVEQQIKRAALVQAPRRLVGLGLRSMRYAGRWIQAVTRKG